MNVPTLSKMKSKLLVLLEKEAFRKGDFTLSSGKKSKYYLDGRVITLTPEGAYLVAGIILEMAKGRSLDAIGGPTLGADPIVGALACLAHQKNTPLVTFIVRKAAKEHGTQRRIEGPRIASGSRVMLVDDVATTGKALVEAKQAMDAAGIIVESALVIVDRLEGAAESLRKIGVKLESIFTIKDFGL